MAAAVCLAKKIPECPGFSAASLSVWVKTFPCSFLLFHAGIIGIFGYNCKSGQAYGNKAVPHMIDIFFGIGGIALVLAVFWLFDRVIVKRQLSEDRRYGGADSSSSLPPGAGGTD